MHFWLLAKHEREKAYSNLAANFSMASTAQSMPAMATLELILENTF
jgi:hypothetical protein